MPKAILVILSFVPLFAFADDVTTKWGKVICEAVTVDQAVAFAQTNFFLDNLDPSADPAYVAPEGTLSCILPLKVEISSTQGQPTSEYMVVNFVDSPLKLPKCVLTYFDSRPARKFSPHGDGEGFDDLPVDSTTDLLDADFADYSSSYQMDEFMTLSLTQTAQIMWTPEVPDDDPHVPIVSQCHVEY
jgi:hypothetical protein